MANSSPACTTTDRISDTAIRLRHRRKRDKKLTYSAEIAIVRRFREYPDRAVGKSQRAEGSRKAHATWPPPLTQVRKVVCVTLDTRDSPQDIPDQGFIGSECRKPAAHRNRACDTLHLGWAMRAGTAKRSRLILWSKERRSATVDCYVWLVVRFTDATAGKIFVRDASAFSIFLRVRQKAKPQPPARLTQVWL